MAKKTKKKKPSEVGKVGRNAKGQFRPGNKLSVGNKGPSKGGKARQLKQALLEAVSVEDMQIIVGKLVEQAKEGEIQAIKELFDRCLGRALQTHAVDVEVKTYTP